ncbi:MAG TPA: 5-oxoprolinase subunit PxpB, partial [Thermomicrobiales bacterium]|nr:5-oxoprolinase subunit PxpB [Thermomicrobiales bacterium]
LSRVMLSEWSALVGSGADDSAAVAREVVIPVVYGGEHGPDLGDVAAHTGLSPDEVVRRHAAGEYAVGALGFVPGFGYLIGLPPELTTPRRATPRVAVPPGSVGIGGVQTGVYSLPTPGGWSLIGRTPLRLFRPESEEPFVIRGGDLVRFDPISLERYDEIAAAETVSSVRPDSSDAKTEATFEVISPGLQTTVQDLGRPGLGRFGVTPGGAADRRALIAANRLVENEDGAAGIEMTLLGPQLRLLRSCRIAIAGADLGAQRNEVPLPFARPIDLAAGDELRFGPVVGGFGARGYLAIAGGIDVPLVMGSRATDLTAGFGGFEGRALRAGDRLATGECQVAAGENPLSLRRGRNHAATATVQAIRIVRGPQAERFDERAWKTFLGESFAVSSRSDRLGARLDGPPVRPTGGSDVISEGMVTGTIQITTDGQPIVMMPARATIGGYAKIATVASADLGLLGQLRPGSRVRFVEVTVEEAFRLARNGDDVEEPGMSLQDAVAIVRAFASLPFSALDLELPARDFSLRLRRGHQASPD